MNFNFDKLNHLLEDRILDVLEPIAIKGLTAFKRILDDSGFSSSPYLKDYSIYSEMSKDSVSFHLVLDVFSIEEESMKKMRKESDNIYSKNAREVKNKDEAKEFLRIYMMKPDGKPQRMVGIRDARKKQKSARKPQTDARKVAYDRNKAKNPENAGERLVDKEYASSSPRSLEVLTDGKLRMTLQREIRNTSRKVIFPKGTYQGIVKELLEEISSIIESSFTRELNAIIKSVY